MKTLLVGTAFLLTAATAFAQNDGRDVPWDDDENMAQASILPDGDVPGARALRIRTSRPACFVAARFPVIRALIEPAETVESARLLFRPQGHPHWYVIPMRRSATGFLAVLPKPRPSAQRVEYVVETTASGHPRARGLELSAPVVEDPLLCAGRPAATIESATIGVRVPRGAPAVPPVPPGFEPVGAVSLEKTGDRSGPSRLLIAGTFAAGVGGLLALSGPQASAGVAEPQHELSFLNSNPPPDSRISLSSGRTLSVRIRVLTRRAVGPGTIRVVLYRFADGGTDHPCAVIMGAHDGFPAEMAQEFVAGGPLQQARVCQPVNRMRLDLQEGNQSVVRSDFVAVYFLDP